MARKYNKTTNQKLHKEFCEICGIKGPTGIEHHHIISRTEVNTSNAPQNLAIICGVCHAKTHAGEIEILGVLPSTSKYGRILIYTIGGICNAPGLEDFIIKPKPIAMKVFYGEKEKSKK